MMRRTWITRKPKPKKPRPDGAPKRELPDMDFWDLVHILDREFSFYVRAGQAASQGHPFVKCSTCDRHDHWKSMDFGHFHQREFFGVRWDLRNGGIQCPTCNRHKEGMKAEMATRLAESGVDLKALQTLKDMWGRTHPSKEDLLRWIREYRAENAKIRKAIKGQD